MEALGEGLGEAIGERLRHDRAVHVVLALERLDRGVEPDARDDGEHPGRGTGSASAAREHRDARHRRIFIDPRDHESIADMTLSVLHRMAAPTIALALLCVGGDAAAHTDGVVAGGFASGVLHPLLGLDHLVAMVAVGLWGAFLGSPAIWLLPVVFPLVMALGGALGIANVPLPAVEIGIASSGVLLGLAVAFGWRAPLALAAVLVGAFAIFHGHAHGTELPAAANPFAYAAGFVLSTGALHLAGVGVGELRRLPHGERAVRAVGAVVALVGTTFLVGSV